MESVGGYNGKVLRVNLSTGRVAVEDIDELFCRRYMGGAGFIAYYLLRELDGDTDPLSAGNKLIFAAGPLTGTAIPGSGRHCVGARSPLTGGIAKSESGGFWGAELKQAGYDAIIIEGRAEKPVYLSIGGGEAGLREAGHLWGTNTKETQQVIREEMGNRLVRVAAIGPGGENQVRFACVINDLHDAAGRGGLGAVMGAKNLKAVAVKGHQRLNVMAPEKIKELSQWLLANRNLWRNFREYGTGAAMDRGVEMGNLPVRNFRGGLFPTVKQIDAETIRDTIRIKMESCYACPVRCKKVVQFEEPYPVDPVYGGPEYETLGSLGSNCGIDDLKAIAKASELCNAYSLDTISTGGVIAFAMECFENGLLTEKDTGGIELRFGNAGAMLETVELIARRRGIGSLLAEGAARAARDIGKGAAEFAMEVKGLEIPMHEPRVKAALGLGYMVNPHGADHCANLHDTMFSQQGPFLERFRTLGILEPQPADKIGPRKLATFRDVHFFRIASDCLVLCQFVPWNPEQVTTMLAAVTGWETSAVEILRTGERMLTLARLFNLREGFTAADDRLPRRFSQPKSDGVLADRFFNADELEMVKGYYYALMGWDAETGIPTPGKLEELDLGWARGALSSG